jgi:hypothetical protein
LLIDKWYPTLTSHEWGEDAVTATEALLQIPGISGNYKVNVNAQEREPVITTVATIVGIVGGTIAIAEQIRKWYQEYEQKKSGKKIDTDLIDIAEQDYYISAFPEDYGVTGRRLYNWLDGSQYCSVKTFFGISDNYISRVSGYFISLTEQY